MEPSAPVREMSDEIKVIVKRDGRAVSFDFNKIAHAIYKAMQAAEEGSEDDARAVAEQVVFEIAKVNREGTPLTVEECQDKVEMCLMEADFHSAAKAYILYRAERDKERVDEGSIPEHVRALAAESKKYFEGNPLGEFVYLRTYARWIEDEQRRETWIETVDRYISFMKENLGDKLTEDEYSMLRESILKQEVMPSMRAMQFSGPAARRCNMCVYNCSFIAPAKIKDFAEVMYISMSGTGVGFAAESENVDKLPEIALQTGEMLDTFVVDDSREGWADALTHGMKTWYAGKDVKFDFSQLRPAGARLKVMGGKSSGPEPLRALLSFARERVIANQGRKLRTIDVHDLCCKIGECVVAGGVRRSAMISLSDLGDELIRDAKKGQFWNTAPHRAIANNSAVYRQKPSAGEFLDEWTALVKAKTGERGIFNRGSLIKMMPERRQEFLLSENNGRVPQMGTNPCGEIVLQSKQTCNLSEVIARADDTERSLIRKARVAAILGTYQSTLTKFGYLSKEWKENCEAERLLGVSVTGQWDCPAFRNGKTMRKMRDAAVEANKEYAERFGIQQSTSVTCVKPSGTVSKTFDNASGMHTRFAPYYIQRIRISATDALFKMMKAQGVPFYPEVGQDMETAHTYVLEFPVKAPDGAAHKNDLTAIEQLEYWKTVKINFTEHNPSVTISVGEDEWIEVANWLYSNWDIIGGLSFLPRSDHVYQLAPMQECTKEEYEALYEKVKDIDYSKILLFEKRDETEQKKELACAGGACDVI